MKLTRTHKTTDGIFGILTIGDFQCFTVENLKLAIQPGVYKVVIDYSPRLKIKTPHLIVPERDKLAGGDAGIRIHPANYPNELKGCIAVGDKIEGNAVLNSRSTFRKLIPLIQDSIEVV